MPTSLTFIPTSLAVRLPFHLTLIFLVRLMWDFWWNSLTLGWLTRFYSLDCNCPDLLFRMYSSNEVRIDSLVDGFTMASFLFSPVKSVCRHEILGWCLRFPSIFVWFVCALTAIVEVIDTPLLLCWYMWTWCPPQFLSYRQNLIDVYTTHLNSFCWLMLMLIHPHTLITQHKYCALQFYIAINEKVSLKKSFILPRHYRTKTFYRTPKWSTSIVRCSHWSTYLMISNVIDNESNTTRKLSIHTMYGLSCHFKDHHIPPKGIALANTLLSTETGPLRISISCVDSITKFPLIMMQVSNRRCVILVNCWEQDTYSTIFG